MQALKIPSQDMRENQCVQLRVMDFTYKFAVLPTHPVGCVTWKIIYMYFLINFTTSISFKMRLYQFIRLSRPQL